MSELPDASTPKGALERAIKLADGQTNLAKLIGVKQQTVSFWLHESGKVGAGFAIPIEQALGGRVSRYELRPDLYPREGEAA